MVEKIKKESENILEENILKLKQIFPNVFSEGKINFKKLEGVLGNNAYSEDEDFSFSWTGKTESLKNTYSQTQGTLIQNKKESINFDNTKNLFIEGDNLEVLKLLQRSYSDKVDLIYIDPPYNTGNDFIYKDDFKNSIENYLEQTGQSKNGIKLTSNLESSGRFHADWMSFMNSRLRLSYNLLKDEGIVFVSIDDNEVNNLRLLMNEIFGEENCIAQIVWKNKFGAGAKTKGFIGLHEYILCYCKNKDNIKNLEIPYSEKSQKMYNKKDEKFSLRGKYGTWPLETTSMNDRPNLRYPIFFEGKEILPKKQWLWSQKRVEEAMKNNELVINEKEGKFSVRFKQYLYDESGNMRKGKPLSIFEGPYTQEGSSKI